MNKIEYAEIMKPCKVDRKKASHVQQLNAVKKSPNYTVEKKLDGVHVLIVGGRIFSTKVSKVTGQLIEKTEHLKHLIPYFIDGPRILEAECYIPGKKVNAVTKYLNKKRGEEGYALQVKNDEFLHLKIFDVQRTGTGVWLTNSHWGFRRDVLAKYQFDSPYISVNPSFNCNEIDVEAFIDEILSNGEEGVVFKNKVDRYYPGKRPMWNWIKLKQEMDDVDVVITGYEPAQKLTTSTAADWPYIINGERVTSNYYHGLIGAIKIGMYDKEGNLVDKGRVSGMDDETRRLFTNLGDRYIGEVITIRAMEESEHGKFRHGSFVRIHPDKNAKECIIEE